MVLLDLFDHAFELFVSISDKLFLLLVVLLQLLDSAVTGLDVADNLIELFFVGGEVLGKDVGKFDQNLLMFRVPEAELLDGKGIRDLGLKLKDSILAFC